MADIHSGYEYCNMKCFILFNGVRSIDTIIFMRILS
nr:MAG TPA: Pollen allergen Ole e 6-helix protein, ALLERGEN [Caudoviricetes sp.]